MYITNVSRTLIGTVFAMWSKACVPIDLNGCVGAAVFGLGQSQFSVHSLMDTSAYINVNEKLSSAFAIGWSNTKAKANKSVRSACNLVII